jgi:hypothetical protein
LGIIIGLSPRPGVAEERNAGGEADYRTSNVDCRAVFLLQAEHDRLILFRDNATGLGRRSRCRLFGIARM